MTCNRCNALELDGGGNCPQCDASAKSTRDEGLLGLAAELGAMWIKNKIGIPVAEPVSHATARDLPPEFQQAKSWTANEMPDAPELSQMLEMEAQFSKRQSDMEIARMWIEHIRTMNKITLGGMK